MHETSRASKQMCVNIQVVDALEKTEYFLYDDAINNFY